MRGLLEGLVGRADPTTDTTNAVSTGHASSLDFADLVLSGTDGDEVANLVGALHPNLTVGFLNACSSGFFADAGRFALRVTYARALQLTGVLSPERQGYEMLADARTALEHPRVNVGRCWPQLKHECLFDWVARRCDEA